MSDLEASDEALADGLREWILHGNATTDGAAAGGLVAHTLRMWRAVLKGQTRVVGG